jgi:putative lipoic acid-binding regulatory protein
MHLPKYLTLALLSDTVMDLSLAFMNPIIVGHYYNVNALNSANENIDDEDAPIIAQSTVKMDDHGSDLTDRFKYKVNALMGEFDPASADTDNENTDGNILNAMLTFPASYIFHIVGKTSGDEEKAEEYVKLVKELVLNNSGDEELECVVKPRGKNFTKIMIETTVQSSSMITNIYEKVAALDETVMSF